MLLSEHGVAVGISEARGGLFLICPARRVDSPILSQVMEQCFQARCTSDHAAVAGKMRGVKYSNLLGCCRCPPGTAADTGAVRRVLGLNSKGGCEVLAGHWTTCLRLWGCSIVARKAVRGFLWPCCEQGAMEKAKFPGLSLAIHAGVSHQDRTEWAPGCGARAAGLSLQGCHCGSGVVSAPSPPAPPSSSWGKASQGLFFTCWGSVLELRTQDMALAPSPNRE